MSRLCWVFVLLAVVVGPSYARDDRPMDCQECQAAGNFTTGVYTVWLGGNPVRVRCDMDTDGGGWTVIQRRGNFSQPQSFDLLWNDYKNGFGSVENEFWLGNDNIFALTNQGNYSLRMDMTSTDGESAFEVFERFRIEDEKANYALHVGGSTGTAGNNMIQFDSKMFTTKDRKNDGSQYESCAELRKGGWWFLGANYNCGWCHPNGLYKPGVLDRRNMFYYDFKQYVGLSSLDMKIKRL